MLIDRLLIAAVLAATLPSFSLSALAADPMGVWKTQEGDAHIRMTRCGSEFCGVTVWIRDQIDPETGKPATDKNNPDPSKRKRPLLGLHIASGFRAAEGAKWVGTFYNADDGQTYNGSMTRTGPTTLNVEGCLLMLCQTQTWTRIGG